MGICVEGNITAVDKDPFLVHSLSPCLSVSMLQCNPSSPPPSPPQAQPLPARWSVQQSKQTSPSSSRQSRCRKSRECVMPCMHGKGIHQREKEKKHHPTPQIPLTKETQSQPIKKIAMSYSPESPQSLILPRGYRGIRVLDFVHSSCDLAAVLGLFPKIEWSVAASHVFFFLFQPFLPGGPVRRARMPINTFCISVIKLALPYPRHTDPKHSHHLCAVCSADPCYLSRPAASAQSPWSRQWPVAR